ncbi:Alpha-galactosidase, NPCBM associated NEW3 domain protein [Methanolacinia petrolearia DSM 11571]|uniref:Alpha-galactosidase, NPCBM associated NEW3 domain protein n=1 Tax=Methanolacinia petrolearia (strain DSM 11571 / OCM 486 / SEBR 4847) TaxID=679926 RepID=E1REB8_METP4|nr:NEW3 domain-containing protein [Methanolacinia petrolearia]ADN36081.1 Alpha-galactosidase, NPCBM associated NEW3 domain protein [Methanolacinia petrolearia DSM 11571]
MTGIIKKMLNCLLISAFLILLLLPQGVLASGNATPNVEITCNFPGRIVEAGETVKFDLKIKNNYGTYPKMLDVDTFKGENDWKFAFYSGENKVDRVLMGKGEELTVTLEVDTAGDTPVDTYPIRIRIDDARLWIYIKIEKTHAGESGVLKVTVVDEQGENIKGAVVQIVDERRHNIVKEVLTTADGQIRTEVEQGDYILNIESSGYIGSQKDDIVIKSGYTTDAGTIMLEKKNYGLTIDVKSPLVTATIGNKPVYEILLSNVGKSDDIFDLSVEDLPAGWYGRYKLAADSTESASSLYIDAGSEKTVFLEIIPPYSVEKGDYSFNISVNSSDYSYKEKLEAKITGSSNMVVFSEKYRYEVTKGDTADLSMTISNKGSGEALTNVRVEVSAPDGWNVRTTPTTIPSIQPGEKATVNLKVTPPANIAASDYKISVKVISDQEEDTEEIKIIVSESSLVGIFGVLLLAGACFGVYYYFRKHERR